MSSKLLANVYMDRYSNYVKVSHHYVWLLKPYDQAFYQVVIK